MSGRAAGTSAATATVHVELTEHHQGILQGTVPDALDAAADRWGDRLALRFIEGEPIALTWSQLREAVGRLRSGLEERGIRAGDAVGIMLTNCAEFPIAWLATIEAGAIAVPMNPKYTAREVSFILEDSGASWLFADASVLSGLPVGSVPIAQDRVITVGGDSRDPRSFETLVRTQLTLRGHRANPLDPVNIQFTSGTTGLPKGCVLTHQYWIELGAYSSALFGEPQRYLADHPFYYLQNQAYFMNALTSGAALYVTQGLSRKKFMGWLHDYQIDFAWIDEGMLDYPPDPRDSRLALKLAPVAALPPTLHAALEERFHLTARDWYASTEVGSGTFVPWERGDLVGSGTMGLCWPTRESKVIDPEGNELPPGVPGELCLRGSGMLLGYHNRPEVNAELFLPGGWFRTGDIVRKDEDGLHYYQGRLRDMIRRSGENISCAEIELHIGVMEGVDEVGVIPVPDSRRGEEVKAIIVRSPGSSIDAAAVEAWCLEGLAPFKVPRFIEFRDELPHTPSGKIAKADLRQEPKARGRGVVDLRPSGATAALRN